MKKSILAIALLLVLMSGCVFFEKPREEKEEFGEDASRRIGISWESINGPPGGRVTALIQNSYKHNELYALTQRGVYKSEDKGESWRLMKGSEGVNSIAAYKDMLFVCANGVSYYDSNENLVMVYDKWCERLAISGDKIFITTASRRKEDLQILYSDLKSGKFDWHDISPSASELKDITIPADTGFDCIIKVPHITTVGNRVFANIMVEMGGGSGECSNGQLYKSEDLGNTWSKVELNKPNELVISNIVRDPNNEEHVIVTFQHKLHDSYLPLHMFLRESYAGGLTWSPVTNISNLEVNSVGDVDITKSSYYITLPKGGQFLKLNKLNRSDYELIDQPRAEGYDKDLIFYLRELLFDLDDPDIVYGRTHDLWAYGLVKSENGMKTWSKMDRDIVASSPSIVVVNPTNPNIIFTTGNTAHEAYLTKDGGKTWMPFSRIAFGDELKIDPHNTNHLILVDENTALFESYNLGKNFSGININAGGKSSFSSAKVFDFEIAKDDPDKIYASNMGLGISKSNLSQSWEPWRYLLSSPDYVYSMKLDPEDSNILYASYSPKIFENYASVWKYSKYQEKNSGWSEILRVENSRGITSLEFDESNPNNIYAGAIGKEGTIYSSRDRGKTWSKLDEDLTFTTIWGQSQLQIDPRDKDTVYAGTWGGGTYKTINGGKDWSLLDENHTFSPTCLAISGKNPNTIYACDRTSPKIHRSTDAGKTWSEYYDFGKDYMLTSAVAIDPDDPNTIYASAFKPPMAHLGGLVKITNGQATPIGKDLPRSVIEIEIDPKNKNTIYAATHIHGVYKSSDGGNNWEELDDKSNGLPRIGVYDIDVDPSNSEILYATALCGPLPDYMMPPQAVQLLTGFKNLDPDGKCGVYKSIDGGKNWSLVLVTLSEARGIDIDPKNPSNLYVADMMGGVWVSNDAGENWRQENNGLGSISMTSVKMKDDYVYASTQGSGVYSGVINRDGSIAWDRSRSNKPKAYVYKIQIEVDPTNSKRIYASAYPGGLLRSDDGGKNWNDKNFLTPSIKVGDPVLQGYYSFEIDQKNTSVIWMGVYGKGMLVSYDGMDFDMFADGDNNAMRGKRITSVRINPNTDEVYAGTQEGVFVTKDDGKHWEAMNDGLETLDIRSLKIANVSYPPFVDDFEDGKADGWGFYSTEQNVDGWSIVRESGNYVLQGIGHVGAVAGSELWSDYTFESKVKLIEGGIHVNYRVGEGGTRYAIGLRGDGMYLMKSTAPYVHINLINVEFPLGKDWNTVKIVGKGGNIKVYLNNELKIDYTDKEPILSGGINFESLPDSKVYVDEVNVTIDVVESTVYAGTAGYGIYKFAPLNKRWQNTGRTLGFGWWNPWERRMYQFSSLLFDPDVPGKVYLGHFPSGFYISEDNGHTWRDSSVGLGNDGMFSLYMHPQNHSILFGGTYNGIAKSEDGGKTWKLKGKKGIENLKGEEAWKAWENHTEGIMPPEQWPYTVAVDSSNPNIIYMTTKNGKNKGYCQRNMNMLGGNDRNHFCGIVMKSTDGGETWSEIMKGLDWGTEFYTLIIYPKNHSVLFLSSNKGVHISTNAGESWEFINDGLPTIGGGVNNQVRDNVADNLALTPDNKYLILGLTNHGAWRTDLSKLNLSSSPTNFSTVQREKKMVGNVTFIDTHAHFFSAGDAVQNADELVEEMDNAGVSKAVLFGGCDQPYFDKNLYVDGIRKEADERVLEAYKKYPDRFYPMISGFDPQNPNSVDYIEEKLKTGIWKGLGEVYLIQFGMLQYKTMANHPNMMKIYRVLAKYNSTIFFHYERRTQEDVDAVHKAMEQNPDVKFVWVHFANVGPNETVESELEKYSNLYISFEGGSLGQDSNYPRELINMLEKYPDRFMIGTDVGCMEDSLVPTDCQQQNCLSSPYGDAIAMHRGLLSELSPQTAEKIAYKNLEGLMGDYTLIHALTPAPIPTPTDRNYMGSGAPVYVPDGYVASNIFSSALVAPWDLAFGPDGDLYVAEFTGSRVSKLTSDGSVSTYVLMPESFRGTARSLAFSPSGDLYVLISNGGLGEGFDGILKISANKTITVLARVGGVEQLAVSPSGDIFVVGTWEGKIFRITPNGTLTTFASGLSRPWDLEFGSSGDLFVFESGTGEISRIAPDGGRTVFASGFGNGGSYLTFDAQGNLFLDDCSGDLYRIAPNGTVTPLEHFSDMVPGCYDGMVFDSYGKLYVADGTGSRIVKVFPNSTASVLVDGFMSSGLAVDPSGDIYAIDTASIQGNPLSTDIIKVSPNKTTFATVSGIASDIDFNAAGDLYVAVFDGGKVLKINPNGEISTFVTGLQNPGRLAFGKSGDLFVLESRNGNVLRITPEGETATFATGFGDFTTGSLYGGLAVDSVGNIFVGSMGGNNTLYEIFPNRTVTTFATNVSDAGFWDGGSITICSSGEIFATEAGRGRLFRISPEEVTLFATGLTNDAHSITCGPSGELLIGRAGSIVKISAR